MLNWEHFLKEFSNHILPIYKKHEETFDKYSIHSRLHISRSIIFAEFMSRYTKNVDFSAIRYAVAFHDSGRKANGPDLWTNDSYKICLSYLKNKYDLEYSEYISSLILKNKFTEDINRNIVYDADVLEIMRPICGHGGRLGFRENELLSCPDIRTELIEDAWKLIIYTENNKEKFLNSDILYRLLSIIEKNKLDFAVLKI